MDEKDSKILKVLESNSRLSMQAIAKKTLIPITTVYHRIKRLENTGIIKRYTIEYDNKKLGKTTCAYVMAQFDIPLLKKKNLTEYDIAKKIRWHDLVEEADLITGEYDILIKLRACSTEEMNTYIVKHLREIECIARTHTQVVIDEG